MTRPSLHWSTILLAAAVVMLVVALYWSTRPATPARPVVRIVTVPETTPAGPSASTYLDTPAPTGCRPVNQRTWAGGIESC